MKLNAIVLSLIGFGLLFAGLAKPVKAQGCTTQYGGAEICPPSKLTITKEIQNPITQNFVKGLSTTDATFSPNGEVLFRVTVKNTSGETLSPVSVQDIFPEFLSFEAGPGTFNQDTKTLTFELDNLIAGESRSVEILGKVDGEGAFPAGRSFLCVVNDVVARALGQSAEDTAQLCIQTQILGVTTLPVAGFNDLFLIVPFASLGLFGFALFKKKA